MTYQNTHRTTLSVVSASGLIGGALIWVIATAIINKETTSEFGPSLEAIAAATGWQGLGSALLTVGVLAFLALSLAGSFAYDLQYRAAAAAEPQPDETAS